MKKVFSFTIGLIAASFVCAVLAKEVGTTRVQTDLMSAPYSDATAAGRLPANTRVDVLERRGGWVQVSTTAANGWVRLHQVRLGEGPEQRGASGVGTLWNVGQTGRSGTQGIVATTGIRGMTATQLKQAPPNPKEVEKLEQYRANDAQARDLAKTGGLKDKDVAWLPKPAE